MDIRTALNGLQQGLSALEAIGAGLGNPGINAALGVAASLTEVGQTILRLADESEAVISAEDKAEVEAVLEAIATRNRALAEKVAAT